MDVYPDIEDVETADIGLLVKWYHQLRAPVGEDERALLDRVWERVTQEREASPQAYKAAVTRSRMHPPTPARARTGDPKTSHDAAAMVNASKHKQFVLRSMRFLAVKHEEPYVTDDQIAAVVLEHLPPNYGKPPTKQSLRSRRAQMCDPEQFDPVLIEHVDDEGEVEETGNKASRWRLTDEGFALAQELARAARR